MLRVVDRSKLSRKFGSETFMDCHFSPEAEELPSEETLTESALRFAEEEEEDDDDDDDNRFVTRLAFKTVDCIANILNQRYKNMQRERERRSKDLVRVCV